MVHTTLLRYVAESVKIKNASSGGRGINGEGRVLEDVEVVKKGKRETPQH